MNKHQKNHTLRYANYFSIRKLTVGVASITLGTALFLSSSHDAQAAENSSTQSDTKTTTTTGQNSDGTPLLEQLQRLIRLIIKTKQIHRKTKTTFNHRLHQQTIQVHKQQPNLTANQTKRLPLRTIKLQLTRIFTTM